MTAYEHRPGTFTLFKVDQQGNDKRPNYSGPGKDLEGNDIEVAAWLKDGGKGKFMSCSFKIKGAQQQKPAQRTPAPQDGGMEVENDIPW